MMLQLRPRVVRRVPMRPEDAYWPAQVRACARRPPRAA
jgi:hypothetical protein